MGRWGDGMIDHKEKDTADSGGEARHPGSTHPYPNFSLPTRSGKDPRDRRLTTCGHQHGSC
jgi:hypothetical protein